MKKLKRLKRPKRYENTVTDLPGGKLSLGMVCPSCGKPICVANNYGMFCEDHCGMAESIKASKQVTSFIESFTKALHLP